MSVVITQFQCNRNRHRCTAVRLS